MKTQMREATQAQSAIGLAHWGHPVPGKGHWILPFFPLRRLWNKEDTNSILQLRKLKSKEGEIRIFDYGFSCVF